MNAGLRTATIMCALAWPLCAQAQAQEPPEAAPALLLGQACSVPPFTEQHVVAGSATWTVDGEGCGLNATLTSGVASAAVAHYARRPDLGNFRMRFRVDLSALSGLNFIQAVQLASGVAGASQPPDAAGTASLFRVAVIGNVAGTQRTLNVFAACVGQPYSQCVASSPLTTAQPTIGLDWTSGAAGSGQLRWWIDTDFDQAPTGVLAADNLTWGALERVVLGLSSPSQGFIALQGGRTVRFDRIEVLEDQLAWQDFEPLDGGACALDPAPMRFIGGGGTTISGNTCGGTYSLTTLASGSTVSFAPERNYLVRITGVGFEQAPRMLWMTVDATPDNLVQAFLCERACSPSARCYLVSGPQAVQGVFEPGDYRLVLKGLPNGCGSATVGFSSTLE